MNNKPLSILFVIITLCVLYLPQSSARPRNDVTTLRTIAGWNQNLQLERDAQEFLQCWFMDNVKYYNDYLKGMEIEKQGKVKLNSINIIKGILGTPGKTNESGKYYIRFLQDKGDPGTLSPYITFHSNNIKVNGQQDDTCNHEGWHAVLGLRSVMELYHFTLSAGEADAPRYYNGNSQPEKVEHIYIENSQALIEWLHLLKQKQFEQTIIEAGEKALKILQKKDPNLTQVDFNKLTPKEQKELIQPIKDIYFSPDVINARNLVYPFCPSIKAELLKYCGMTFLDPDEVDRFYQNGGLQTSNGKKIILPDDFLKKENVYAKAQVILNIMQETPYSEIYPDLVQSYVVVRPMHVANLNNQNFDPQRNYSPEKGYLTFELEDQSENTFIKLTGKSSDGIKLKTPDRPAKRISVDLNEIYKNELQNKQKNLLFKLDFYLKNPGELKQPQSYKVTIKFEDQDYARKISQTTYQDVINTYSFEIDPSKFAVTITSTNKDKKYSFQAKTPKAYKEYNWIITDESGSELYNSTVASDKIDYEFKNTGKYEIKVRPLNDKGKYIGEAKTNVNVGAKTKDKVDTAFDKRDYKTLCLSTNGNFDLEQVKRALKYLHIIADEFLVKDKALLKEFEQFLKEDEEAYKAALTPIESELKELRKDNEKGKNDAAIEKLNKCKDGLYQVHEKQKYKIENSIRVIKDAIEYIENYYTTVNPDEDVNKNPPQIAMFEDSDHIKTKLDFDPDQPLVVYDYKGVCSADGSVDLNNKFKITLKASKKLAKANEQVALAVKYENDNCDGSPQLRWKNNAASVGGLEGVFVASAPGSYGPTVTAVCKGKDLGSDSITIRVTGQTKGKIQGLEENQVYFGTKKEIKLKTDLIAKPDTTDNSCKDNPNNPFCVDTISSGSIKSVSIKDPPPGTIYIPNPDEEFEDEPKDWRYKVLWQSNRGLKFDPKEIKGDGYSNFSTDVTFDRIENPTLIWAEIYEFKDGSYETIGESDQIEIEVIPPQFEMKFNPTQDKAKIGKEVQVNIYANPPVDEKIIDYRWVEPTDRLELENGSIKFTPKDGKTVNFHVIARVPHHGDTIDDKIKDQYTPGEYIVTATLVGPKFDKDSQEWSAADKGLVTKKKPLVTGQQILVAADIIDFDTDEANFEWSSNEGCHIDAGHNSQEVTVSRNEPGSCDLTVIAYDKDKRRLGSDQTSFNINPQDSSTVKSNDNKDIDKTDKTDKALKDKANKDKALKDKAEKNQKTNETIDKIEKATQTGDFTSANDAIETFTNSYPDDPIIKDLKDKVSKAKDIYKETKITKAQSAIDKGNLEEAETILQEAKDNLPEETEINDILTEVKNDKTQIKDLKDKFNEAVNNGDYSAAENIVKDMTAISRNNKTVTEARNTITIINNEGINKLTGKLSGINDLVNSGDIDEAIAKAEEIATEAKNYKHAENIILTANNKAKDLKNKKSICESSLQEAKRLIDAGQYDSAERLLNNAKLALPTYKGVAELENRLNQIKAELNDKKNKVKQLSDEAFNASRSCKHDEAIELIQQAKELDPDSSLISRYNYEINNKKTIFQQDMDRSKLYLDRGDIDFAKQELAKHESDCANNPEFITAKKRIDDYYANKNSEITAKIAEIRALLNAKEYSKVVSLAKETRATLHPAGENAVQISDMESTALKKINEQKGAINYINIIQTHLNQYNYQGCLSQLGVLDNQYPDCWEPSSEEPERISKLRTECQTKSNRLNEILPIVKNAALSPNVSAQDLGKANILSDELVNLNPNNYDYGKYRTLIKQKITNISQSNTQPQNTQPQSGGRTSIYDTWKKNKQNNQTWNQTATNPPSNQGQSWGQTTTPPPVRTPQTNNNYKDRQLYDNGNIGACGYTNTGTFTIQRSLNVSVLEAYYNWKQGQSTEKFTLYKDGTALGAGYFTKDICSPGTSWCKGKNNLNKLLSPGRYTVKTTDSRICKNSGTGGNGVIRIYSKDPNASSSDIASSTKNVRPINQTTTQPTTSTPVSSSSGSFDGKYSGTCRIHSGSGTCNVSMNVLNNQVSGNISGLIEGDKVNASFTGAIIMPGAQYSQKSASVKTTITKGSILDHKDNKMLNFTGSLSGTIYSSGNASGDLKFIISGLGAGPTGEWKVTRGGSVSTVKPTTRPVKTSKGLNTPKFLTITFKNMSGTPVHYTGIIPQCCSPSNRVMPGGIRQSSLKAAMSINKFHIGRNGKIIGTVSIPLSSVSNHEKILLIYDSAGRFYWSK